MEREGGCLAVVAGALLGGTAGCAVTWNTVQGAEAGGTLLGAPVGGFVGFLLWRAAAAVAGSRSRQAAERESARREEELWLARMRHLSRVQQLGAAASNLLRSPDIPVPDEDVLFAVKTYSNHSAGLEDRFASASFLVGMAEPEE